MTANPAKFQLMFLGDKGRNSTSILVDFDNVYHTY